MENENLLEEENKESSNEVNINELVSNYFKELQEQINTLNKTIKDMKTREIIESDEKETKEEFDIWKGIR